MRFAGWILIATLSGCGAKTATTTPTPAVAPPKPVAPPVDKDPLVAARVDGVEILTWDVDRHIDAATKDKLKQTTDPKARDALRVKARHRVLTEMIDRQLLVAAAMARKIQAGDEEIDAALKEIRVQNNNMTEAQLTEAITAAGFGSLEDYKKELGEQIQVLRLIAQIAPPPEPNDVATRRIIGELRAKAKIVVALPEPPSSSGLGLNAIITTADLQAVLGHALPQFETGPLDSDEPTTDYDSWHFKAVGQAETSDLAVRVWRESPKDLEKRWTELHSQLPDVHDETGLGDASFRASGSDIFGRAYIDRKASIVMLLTCGSGLCTSPEQALAIAKLVHERQGRLKHPR